MVSRDLQLTGDIGINQVKNRRNTRGRDIRPSSDGYKVISVYRDRLSLSVKSLLR